MSGADAAMRIVRIANSHELGDLRQEMIGSVITDAAGQGGLLQSIDWLTELTVCLGSALTAYADEVQGVSR